MDRSRAVYGSISVSALILAIATSANAQPQPGGPQPGMPPEGGPTPYAQPCGPACRAGYVCFRGACFSACNPPCGDEQTCTADGRCVAQQDAEESPAAVAEREALERRREAAVMSLRFTLHGLMTASVWSDGTPGVGVTAAVGVRKNVNQWFGVHLRAGVGIAYVGIRDAMVVSGAGTTIKIEESDSTMTKEAYGDFVPYFQIGRSYYMGPILWVGRFAFDKNTLETFARTVSLPDRWLGGGGLDMGLLLLGRGQLDVNWRAKSSFTDQMPFRFECGVGYHFM
jgi:hypothetical protein